MSSPRSTLFALLSVCCLLLTSCGFEPVYGARAAAATQGKLIVEPIPGREGQILKIALEDTLNPESVSVLNAPYSLRTVLKREIVPAVISGDASIQRYNIVVSAQFAVIDRATLKPVYQGSARRYGSYSRSSEDYSTFTADRDVTKRTFEELARDIAQRLGALNLAPSGMGL